MKKGKKKQINRRAKKMKEDTRIGTLGSRDHSRCRDPSTQTMGLLFHSFFLFSLAFFNRMMNLLFKSRKARTKGGPVPFTPLSLLGRIKKRKGKERK